LAPAMTAIYESDGDGFWSIVGMSFTWLTDNKYPNHASFPVTLSIPQK